MEHLSLESLARLVDERPTELEREHLAACDSCARALTDLQEQTRALRALPEILPPKGDWQVLEAELRSEGLLRDPGFLTKVGLARTPEWMKAAAAVLLFLGGAGTGVAATADRGPAGDGAPAVAFASNVENAAARVRVAEQDYVTAVAEYREILARDGGEGQGADPISRFAALEHLVMVSQAAVRQAPGDPFLNGFLASAMAERDAALRMVSASRDNWF